MRSTNRLVLGPAGSPAGGVGSLSTAEIVDVIVEAPIVARQADRRVLFGASAAGPLGGDRIDIDVVIQPGVYADLGTVGATMVLPNRVPATSSTETAISVASGSHLHWRPEPMISVVGSMHETSLVVRLAATATCRVIEEFALGRTAEISGVLTTRLRIERDGAAVVHHAETFGPDRPGTGSVAAGPVTGHVITDVVIGQRSSSTSVSDDGNVSGAGPDPASPIVEADRWAGSFSMGPDATMAVAIAPDRPSALALLDRLRTAAMV